MPNFLCVNQAPSTYDGKSRRCRVADATGYASFTNGETTQTFTTDEDGRPGAALILTTKPDACDLAFTKTGYRGVRVKSKVTWDSDSGSLGLLEVFLQPT